MAVLTDAKVKRASRVLGAVSVWVLFLLSSARALADDAPAQKALDPAADATRPSDASGGVFSETTPKQEAAFAYQQALASYAKGDLAAALDSMRKSYQISKRPELLYNVAKLEDELKACPDSLEDYRRYLELVPQGHYREEAAQASERLGHECPPPAAAPTTTVVVPPPAAIAPLADADAAQPLPSEPPADPYWTPPRVLGWSAIAAGTLAGIGALHFQLEAIQARNELQKDVDDGPPLDMSLQTRQHHTNHTAIALAITGGAMVAGGALVLLLDSAKDEPSSRSARVYAAPGSIGAYFTQGF